MFSAVKKWNQGAKGASELLCEEKAGVTHINVIHDNGFLQSVPGGRWIFPGGGQMGSSNIELQGKTEKLVLDFLDPIKELKEEK